MSPVGKGPLWLSILAETFWLVQTSEINMHHASRECPVIIAAGLTGGVGSYEVLETAPNCTQGDPP